MTITIQKIVGCVGALLVGVGVTGFAGPASGVCIVLGAAIYGLASC